MTAKEFITGLPEKVNPAVLEGVQTNFHFDIEGEGGGQFSVIVEGGKVAVKEGFEGEAKCKVSAKADNLMGVVKGDINPMMAVLTGKVKISNQAEMLKYAKIFGLM